MDLVYKQDISKRKEKKCRNNPLVLNRQIYCNYNKSNTAILVSQGLIALILLGKQGQLQLAWRSSQQFI